MKLIVDKEIGEINLMIADEISVSIKMKKEVEKFMYSLADLKIMIDEIEKITHYERSETKKNKQKQ